MGGIACLHLRKIPGPPSFPACAIATRLPRSNGCAAPLDFGKHLVVPNADGTIAHAQLSFGNGMIMLGSVVESEFGRLMKQPDEIDGAETQSAYVVVSDADAVHDRAKAAGAEMIMDIQDNDYGGRGFSCRDVEGHIWNFGSYDPWEPE